MTIWRKERWTLLWRKGAIIINSVRCKKLLILMLNHSRLNTDQVVLIFYIYRSSAELFHSNTYEDSIILNMDTYMCRIRQRFDSRIRPLSWISEAKALSRDASILSRKIIFEWFRLHIFLHIVLVTSLITSLKSIFWNRQISGISSGNVNFSKHNCIKVVRKSKEQYRHEFSVTPASVCRWKSSNIESTSRPSNVVSPTTWLRR